MRSSMDDAGQNFGHPSDGPSAAPQIVYLCTTASPPCKRNLPTLATESTRPYNHKNPASSLPAKYFCFPTEIRLYDSPSRSFKGRSDRHGRGRGCVDAKLRLTPAARASAKSMWSGARWLKRVEAIRMRGWQQSRLTGEITL